MTNDKKISVSEAKGRPMLHWVGKQPLSYVTAFPAQIIEKYNPCNENINNQGLLFHGNNKDIIAWLLANGYRGEIDFIYIDPPFDSGADYVRQIELRGVDLNKIEGEAHSLGEQIQYTDIWANDMYLQFMYERLLLLKELLSDQGSICVHIDYRRTHHLRLILDEIFGDSGFRNEIIWCYTGPSKTTSHFPRKHDAILWYSKSNDYTFNVEELRVPYKKSNLATGETALAGKASDDDLKKLDERGKLIEDWWPDIATIGYKHDEILNFPTQKPESLLTRLICGLSKPTDLILDIFVGSGTTAAVAQKLGRRWIAADINIGAVQITSKRIQKIIQDQVAQNETPPDVLEEDKINKVSIPPISLSFQVLRVNDYDIQIQHNEAINLAVEHIGINRIKTDSYFDGTLGDKLVKIIPFNHPVTLLDLQTVKEELEQRQDERNVIVVCLGKEMALDPWLSDYNKHHPINRIELIELRSDKKYGKLFIHNPAQAKIEMRREKENIVIDIVDFISPTIVERLEMDTPIFKIEIPDWRAMVDCVMIDLNYDGEVFNIDHSDMPEEKNELVEGHYKIQTSKDKTTIAVKIIDMLGEEVIVTKHV